MTQTPPAGAPAYPVTVDFERDDAVQNWRPLVNWLLAIPHALVLWALTVVSRIILLVTLFTVLFTKDIPEGLFNFQVMVNRYSLRFGTFVLFMRNEYPKFEFPMEPADPGDDPARYSVVKPAEYNRWLPLVKWLLAIPHYFVLVFLFIGLAACVLIAFFVVLFTGKWPEDLRSFVVGVMRWSNRVNAYVYLLVDEYPLFSLE